MTARPVRPQRPEWTLVRDDDPRHRPGAVEAPAYVSAQWAGRIKAASNRPWTNAAKVVAELAEECGGARYVEGWAVRSDPVWHAWVEVPLGTSEQSWLRIDPTPLWRWSLQHNGYAPVLEVRASVLAPFAAPLLQPRGRALCRLPLVPLAPTHKLGSHHPVPADSFAAEFGTAAAWRASQLREALLTMRAEQARLGYADGRAEMDRFAAMRVLPKER